MAYYSNNASAPTDQNNEEVTSLRASVKAKEIEVEDLIETVDRLQTEKSELEQEVTDLTMQNQDLKRDHDEMMPNTSEGVDFAIYEDTKQNLDDTTEKLSKIKEELASKDKSLEAEIRDKQAAEQQSLKLQNDLSTLKVELETVKEVKNDIENDKSKLKQINQDLEQNNQTLVELSIKSHEEREYKLTQSQKEMAHKNYIPSNMQHKRLKYIKINTWKPNATSRKNK